MPTISSSIKNGQLLQFKAGGQVISVGDLVQIGGQELKAYPVKTIDYAVRAATATILAQTNLGGAATTGDRPGVVTDQYGFIFNLFAGQLQKFSPTYGSGALFTNSSAVAGTGSGTLLVLSNGNIAAIGVNISTGAITYGVCDALCNSIKASTAVGTGFNAASTTFFGACTLTGGGFAIAYLNSAGTQILLQTYDNTGTAVLGATNIQTLGGTPTLVNTRLAQLSNGNLVASFKSQVATPVGLSFVIVTTAGVSVVANTAVDTTAAAGFQDLSVMTGFFTVGAPNGTNIKGAVYNNAGVLQGGAYTLTDANNPSTFMTMRLLNDGTQFWCAHNSTAANFVGKIPTSGTGFVNTQIGTPNTTFSLDAAIVGNIMLIYLGATDTGASSLLHVQLPDAEVPTTAPTQISSTTVGSAAATTGTFWPKIVFNGDFTAVLVYDKQNSLSTNIAIYKVAATAIEGVAVAANANNSPGSYGAGSTITVNTGPGSYPTNAIPGTSGMGFSHSSQAISGNNGKIFNNSVALTGVGMPRNIN